MTYDYELILLGQDYPKDDQGNPMTDEIGNQIVVESENAILCGLKSVGRTEFYNSAVAGLRPEFVFVVHVYEYDDQKKVKFDGVKYNVIRTYAVGLEDLEITCERVAADG